MYLTRELVQRTRQRSGVEISPASEESTMALPRPLPHGSPSHLVLSPPGAYGDKAPPERGFQSVPSDAFQPGRGKGEPPLRLSSTDLV